MEAGLCLRWFDDASQIPPDVMEPLLALIADRFPGTGAEILEGIETGVVLADGEPVACMSYHWPTRTVENVCSSRGVAGWMLREFLRRFDPCRPVQLRVDRTTPCAERARALYERVGFEATRETRASVFMALA